MIPKLIFGLGETETFIEFEDDVPVLVTRTRLRIDIEAKEEVGEAEGTQ